VNAYEDRLAQHLSEGDMESVAEIQAVVRYMHGYIDEQAED